MLESIPDILEIRFSKIDGDLGDLCAAQAQLAGEVRMLNQRMLDGFGQVMSEFADLKGEVSTLKSEISDIKRILEERLLGT